jgi:hypothetical protein
VQKGVDKLKSGVSLPKARSAFLEFVPPASSHAGVANPSKRFALEADTALSNGLQITDKTLVGPQTAKKWDKQALLRNKGAAKEAHASENKEVVLTEEGIAKAVADKAIEIANALTQKFPAKNKTAHQGQYDTLEDTFGNHIPVVVVDGKWVVLTERSLIARRKAPKFWHHERDACKAASSTCGQRKTEETVGR